MQRCSLSGARRLLLLACLATCANSYKSKKCGVQVVAIEQIKYKPVPVEIMDKKEEYHHEHKEIPHIDFSEHHKLQEKYKFPKKYESYYSDNNHNIPDYRSRPEHHHEPEYHHESEYHHRKPDYHHEPDYGPPPPSFHHGPPRHSYGEESSRYQHENEGYEGPPSMSYDQSQQEEHEEDPGPYRNLAPVSYMAPSGKQNQYKQSNYPRIPPLKISINLPSSGKAGGGGSQEMTYDVPQKNIEANHEPQENNSPQHEDDEVDNQNTESSVAPRPRKQRRPQKKRKEGQLMEMTTTQEDDGTHQEGSPEGGQEMSGGNDVQSSFSPDSLKNLMSQVSQDGEVMGYRVRQPLAAADGALLTQQFANSLVNQQTAASGITLSDLLTNRARG